MAVYTQLTRDDIEDFLEKYDCGRLVSFDGILQGVENTNYKIETDRNNYILTIFEERTNAAELPFFFSFMAHLKERGIYCPSVLADKEGKTIQTVSGKSASLISFLDGHNIDTSAITPQLSFEAGVLLARMHLAAQDFDDTRDNSMSLSAWKTLFTKIKNRADEIEKNLSSLIEIELSAAEVALSADLPKAVTHADFFPDNVFMRDGRVEGVIDFYFSATDYLIYDFAIAVNAWCFKEGIFKSDKFETFLAGYESHRILLAEERAAFQGMARAGALRILMTRAHDWIFHDLGNLVKPKDPLEYKRILEFYRDNVLFG